MNQKLSVDCPVCGVTNDNILRGRPTLTPGQKVSFLTSCQGCEKELEINILYYGINSVVTASHKNQPQNTVQDSKKEEMYNTFKSGFTIANDTYNEEEIRTLFEKWYVSFKGITKTTT